MENDYIYFSARFGGVARDIVVPVENVVAIYARENGQGMAFEMLKPSTEEASRQKPADNAASSVGMETALSAVPSSDADASAKPDGSPNDEGPEPPKKGGRPTLTRIKLSIIPVSYHAGLAHPEEHLICILGV